jgi:hypothetical protein
MTEAEWLACTHPTPMVNFLRGKASDRKLRLLFCACCRSVWQVLDEPLLKHAVEVAERHADGFADDQQLEVVRREICPDPHFILDNEKAAAAFGAVAGNSFPVWAIDAVANLASAEAARQALDQGRTHLPPGTMKGIRQFQARLLRCIVGPLSFRSVNVYDNWLTWQDATIPKLARAIYDDRAFQHLPILADALEEAGCTNPDILAHCRQPGEHVRGCWVVDLVLGKE